MVNSVLMAGGKVKNTLGSKIDKFFYRQIYHENYLWGDYKPLKEIELDLNGEKKKRFLIEYVLSALDNSEMIDKVVVVGEKRLLKDKVNFNNYENVMVVQQGKSLIENAELGYSNCFGEGKILFVPVDVPLVSGEEIDEFITKCIVAEGDYDVFCAVTSKGVLERGNSFEDRPYFWVIDEESEIKEDLDKYGRKGFRAGNFFFANPNNIGKAHYINGAYSVRKLLNPMNIFRLACCMIPESRKYFLKKLTRADLEKKVGDLLETRFKFMDTDSPTFSLDVDSQEDVKNIESYINFRQ